MALLSDLVRTVALVEGLDEVSVGIFARAAREAGYISQGGRGRSAARMTVRDAANLLIAVNGCALAKDVRQNLPLFRELRVNKASVENRIGIGERFSKFGDDLEWLIEYIKVHNDLTPGDDYLVKIAIRFERPILRANIQLHFEEKDAEDRFSHAEYGWIEYEDLDLFGDRSDETIISDKTLIAVAKSLSS